MIFDDDGSGDKGCAQYSKKYNMTLSNVSTSIVRICAFCYHIAHRRCALALLTKLQYECHLPDHGMV